MGSKSPTDLLKPEFPIGSVVEIKNNADRIPLEDRIGIVKEYFLTDAYTDNPYIAYNVELVSKPGVFRLRTKQFLKDANMSSKSPTPPPKFNIGDIVYFKDVAYRVTNRRYTVGPWKYSLVEHDVLIPRHKLVKEDLLVHGPLQVPAKFKIGDFVKYNTWLCQVVMYDYNDERKEYQYEIKHFHGKHYYRIRERDLTLHTIQPNNPTTANEKGYFDDIDGKWVEESNPQDNQTVTNNQGGKQSFVSARFDCIPPVVLRLLAQCLGFGARKYGKENWKNIEQWDHLNHAINHINEWNRGDRSEPHLVNAMARLTFALWHAVDQKQQPDTYIHPDEKQS